MSFAVMGLNDNEIVSGGTDETVRVWDNNNNNNENGFARLDGDGRNCINTGLYYGNHSKNNQKNRKGQKLVCCNFICCINITYH